MDEGREEQSPEGQDRSGGSDKDIKVQISAKFRGAKYHRCSLEVVSLGRAQNNHDVRLTISLG
jgi:hypothetical protein